MSKAYTMGRGSAAGIQIFKVRDVAAEPKPSMPADVIEPGGTRLKFVPLCGADFDWEDRAARQASSRNTIAVIV